MTIRWKDKRRPRWNEGGREASKADCDWDAAHPGRVLIFFGRCRSGRRWFWTAYQYDFGNDLKFSYDWTDTEDGALASARAEVERIAAGQDAVAILSHDVASRQIKKINLTKRAARLAANPSTVKDSKPVEYLFARGVYAFPIIKRSARRIYYKRGHYDWLPEIDNIDPTSWRDNFDNAIGFVDRQELETKGEVYNHGRHWSSDDFHLYIKPPIVHEPEPELPDLAELKMAMADAHPDHGGSNAAFIEARKHYVEARSFLQGR